MSGQRARVIAEANSDGLVELTTVCGGGSWSVTVYLLPATAERLAYDLRVAAQHVRRAVGDPGLTVTNEPDDREGTR